MLINDNSYFFIFFYTYNIIFSYELVFRLIKIYKYKNNKNLIQTDDII